jgi:hypothetical protein
VQMKVRAGLITGRRPAACSRRIPHLVWHAAIVGAVILRSGRPGKGGGPASGDAGPSP